MLSLLCWQLSHYCGSNRTVLVPQPVTRAFMPCGVSKTTAVAPLPNHQKLPVYCSNIGSASMGDSSCTLCYSSILAQMAVSVHISVKPDHLRGCTPRVNTEGPHVIRGSFQCSNAANAGVELLHGSLPEGSDSREQSGDHRHHLSHGQPASYLLHAFHVCCAVTAPCSAALRCMQTASGFSQCW